MLLFTVGPVMMYQEVLDMSGEQLPYFRTDAFSDTMQSMEKSIKNMAGSDSTSVVSFITASGTGAMEATVINVFNKKDRLLIISGGSFGERFEEICEANSIEYDPVKIEHGERLTEEKLMKYSTNSYSGMLVNLNETSTGQLYDINMLSNFCSKKGMTFVVDAISSFLADDINMVRDKIDVLIISSQKALAVAPGISIIIMNKRTYDDRVSSNNPNSFYFDLKKYCADQTRGQTPFTPAVGVLLQLRKMFDIIEKNGGTNQKIIETQKMAVYFRSRIKEIGLKIPDYPLSNALTPIIFNNGAYQIFEKLKNDYDMYVTPSGGKLRDCMIRVGHMGDLKNEDYDKLIDAFKRVLS